MTYGVIVDLIKRCNVCSDVWISNRDVVCKVIYVVFLKRCSAGRDVHVYGSWKEMSEVHCIFPIEM